MNIPGNELFIYLYNRNCKLVNGASRTCFMIPVQSFYFAVSTTKPPLQMVLKVTCLKQICCEIGAKKTKNCWQKWPKHLTQLFGSKLQR